MKRRSVHKLPWSQRKIGANSNALKGLPVQIGLGEAVCAHLHSWIFTGPMVGECLVVVDQKSVTEQKTDQLKCQIGDRTHAKDHNCDALMSGAPPPVSTSRASKRVICDSNETSKDILLSSFQYRIPFLHFFSGKNKRLRLSTLVGSKVEITFPRGVRLSLR
jgi:hypothetical protein